MIWVDEKTSATEIYAIHIWEDFIRRALKAVRVAENASKPLNQCTLSTNFSPADRHDEDLMAWMQGVIATHEPNYQQKKQKLHQAVGYEDGRGMGTVTISASNFDDIANNFLGLGSGLSLSEFCFTPSRFGILSPKPDVDYRGEGKLIITPNPIDTCEVRLRANGVLYSLKGQVFALGKPLLPRQEMRIRFSAEFLEMVVVASTPPQVKTISARIDPDSKRTLHTLEAFAALNECCQAETEVDLQVWARGKRALSGTLSLNGKTLSAVSWGRLAVAMRKLRGLLIGNENSVKVSLKEAIKGGQRLAVFAVTINAPSFRLEFEPTEDTPPKIDSLIFYSFAEIGNFLFFSLWTPN